MQRIAYIALIVSISVLHLRAQAPGMGVPKLPRPVPPLEVTMPDGTKLILSRYAGKVCVVEFLFTTCPHCQETAHVLTKLAQEYGPRGFQPIGAAFNDNAMLLVPGFVQTYHVGYPVGVVPRDSVLQFMNYSVMARLMVPMVAIIDKKGQIRYQSSPEGAEVLHSEASLRQKIEELLKEPGSAATPKKSVVTKKTD